MSKLSETDLWCIVSFIGDSYTYLSLAATCKYFHEALVKTEYKNIYSHLVFFADDGYKLPSGCKTIRIKRAKAILGLGYRNDFHEYQELYKTDYHSRYMGNCVLNINCGRVIICRSIVDWSSLRFQQAPTSLVISRSMIRGVTMVFGTVNIYLEDSIIDIDPAGILKYKIDGICNCTDLTRNISINKPTNEGFVFTAKYMTRRQLRKILDLRLYNAEIIVDVDENPLAVSHMVSIGGVTQGFICRLKITRQTP